MCSMCEAETPYTLCDNCAAFLPVLPEICDLPLPSGKTCQQTDGHDEECDEDNEGMADTEDCSI